MAPRLRTILRDIRLGKYAKIVASLHPRAHQLQNETAFNRYPEIFGAAAAAAPDARRILSFGCSTGEECVSLANYFPEAQIVGSDINFLNLIKASRYQSHRISFVYASDRILSALGVFDAVFCMAVLRTSKRKRIAHHYPFERFAERANYLESLVRPGGLLIIHNATYRFSDTTRRYTYDAVPIDAMHDKVYMPDGITEVAPDGCIFRKRSTLKNAQAETASKTHISVSSSIPGT
jgi:hypothetical protein